MIQKKIQDLNYEKTKKRYKKYIYLYLEREFEKVSQPGTEVKKDDRWSWEDTEKR